MLIAHIDVHEFCIFKKCIFFQLPDLMIKGDPKHKKLHQRFLVFLTIEHLLFYQREYCYSYTEYTSTVFCYRDDCSCLQVLNKAEYLPNMSICYAGCR